MVQNLQRTRCTYTEEGAFQEKNGSVPQDGPKFFQGESPGFSTVDQFRGKCMEQSCFYYE